MKGKNGLMTHGNIAKQLIVFAIPLLVGNLFQQLYNTVDSIVVGNFIGDQALAAVNSSLFPETYCKLLICWLVFLWGYH